MIFASGLGLVLSLVFGCLLLAIIAELYYLLWRKKLRDNSTSRRVEDDDKTHGKELFYHFCWNKPPKPSQTNAPSNPEPGQDPLDLEQGSSKEILVRAQETAMAEEEQLMRLQNRLLFTIKEETKEDLESEDGKSKASRKGSRTRSLSDLIMAVDTPLSSPPLTKNLSSVDCYSRHGFNPLFEAELSRMRSSPPPKLKFLRDAEEKLYRKLLEEAEKINRVELGDENGGFQNSVAERVFVGKNNLHSASSQVLPLPSSPTKLTSSIDKKPSLD